MARSRLWRMRACWALRSIRAMGASVAVSSSVRAFIIFPGAKMDRTDRELLSERTVAMAILVGQNRGQHRMLGAFARLQGRLADMRDRLDGWTRIRKRKARARDDVLVAHGVQVFEAFREVVRPEAMDGH